MPRKTLADTELPIEETDIEEGTLPFFLIDDEYGIACDQYCYMLCKKKRANRTIKDEDGKPNHIESYWNWTPFKYTGTFQSIMETYVEQKERGLNKRIIKSKDFKEILETYNKIHKIISDAVDIEGLNKSFMSVTSLLDQKEKLLQKISEVHELKEDLLKEYNELQILIKQKRKIIVDKHKPLKN